MCRPAGIEKETLISGEKRKLLKLTQVSEGGNDSDFYHWKSFCLDTNQRADSHCGLKLTHGDVVVSADAAAAVERIPEVKLSVPRSTASQSAS